MQFRHLWAAIFAGFQIVAGWPGTALSAEMPSLSCSFTSGTVSMLSSGVYTAKPAEALAFGIEAIDLDQQTARLVVKGNAAGNSLRAVRALNANHFLEVAQEGFLNVTTVYDYDADAKAYPAVHSRHFGILGQPIFAQYAGFCTKK